jgi:hypothetical protein
MNIAGTAPSPIEIDPRPCDWCGLTIDRHVMFDDGEGPEFFCPEIHPHAADLVRQWELEDERDRWKHMGEISPRRPAPSRHRLVARDGVASAAELERMIDEFGRRRRASNGRPAQSTIAAFWYVASLDDPNHLKRWLSEHPRDVVALQTLWEAKHARA